MAKIPSWWHAVIAPTDDRGRANRTQIGFVLGSYALFVVIGLAVPESVLRDYAWAKNFSDVMASIVPQIDRVTQLSAAMHAKADVNRFYYSFLWAISPLYFAIFYNSSNQYIKTNYKIESMFAVLPHILFMLVVSLFIFFWPTEGGSRIEGMLFKHRLSSIFLGPMMVPGIMVMVSLLFVLIKGLMTGDIYYKSGERGHGR